MKEYSKIPFGSRKPFIAKNPFIVAEDLEANIVEEKFGEPSIEPFSKRKLGDKCIEELGETSPYPQKIGR